MKPSTMPCRSNNWYGTINIVFLLSSSARSPYLVPSSIPKYPPSKELDAKARDEEARRRRAEAKGHGAKSVRMGSRDLKIEHSLEFIP
ncbi:hypothetical protein GH714_013994 [Hevea brasiliensis]|uniref:Uncharacterized protein n=1 Tax=Hevea brasiliensis TaxID=3981 RepID=A0A6A6LBJ8_HEVBR|nr:hypothetical protein GH714_013994 [Hevea brasiliensis]